MCVYYDWEYPKGNEWIGSAISCLFLLNKHIFPQLLPWEILNSSKFDLEAQPKMVVFPNVC